MLLIRSSVAVIKLFIVAFPTNSPVASKRALAPTNSDVALPLTFTVLFPSCRVDVDNLVADRSDVPVVLAIVRLVVFSVALAAAANAWNDMLFTELLTVVLPVTKLDVESSADVKLVLFTTVLTVLLPTCSLSVVRVASPTVSWAGVRTEFDVELAIVSVSDVKIPNTVEFPTSTSVRSIDTVPTFMPATSIVTLAVLLATTALVGLIVNVPDELAKVLLVELIDEYKVAFPTASASAVMTRLAPTARLVAFTLDTPMLSSPAVKLAIEVELDIRRIVPLATRLADVLPDSSPISILKFLFDILVPTNCTA